MNPKKSTDGWQEGPAQPKFQDIGWMVVQAKAGKKLRRPEWTRLSWVVLMPSLYLPPFSTQDTSRKVNDRTAKHIGEDTPLDSQPYFAAWTTDGKWQPGWLPSQADLLATNWEVVD